MASSPAFSTLCSMRCLMGFAPWVVFSSLLSRAWPISRSGSQLVNQHSGLPAPSRVSTRQTAGRRSTTSSKPIPWPVAFVQLWLIGPYGLGPRQIFCCCPQKVLAKRNSSGSSWAKNPRALAGRLRRAQTFLRTLGIEVTFSREGRTGSRMIRGEHEDRRLRQQRQSHPVGPDLDQGVADEKFKKPLQLDLLQEHKRPSTI